MHRASGAKGGVLGLGLAGLALLAFGCATGGDDSGSFGGDDGGALPDTSGGRDGSVDAGVAPPDAGSGTPDVGSPLDSGSAQDSGAGTPDTGGGQPDSGECSVTSTSKCGNGAACCINNDVASCACQAGTATQGGACSMTVACAPGYACAIEQGSSNGSCLQWCAYPGGACPQGTTCQNLFSPAPMAGGVTYGACM